MALQNPDDLICRPPTFVEFKDDGTTVKTFDIREPWSVHATHQIGSLMVWDSIAGPLLSITFEKESD